MLHTQYVREWSLPETTTIEHLEELMTNLRRHECVRPYDVRFNPSNRILTVRVTTEPHSRESAPPSTHEFADGYLFAVAILAIEDRLDDWAEADTRSWGIEKVSSEGRVMKFVGYWPEKVDEDGD